DEQGAATVDGPVERGLDPTAGGAVVDAAGRLVERAHERRADPPGGEEGGGDAVDHDDVAAGDPAQHPPRGRGGEGERQRRQRHEVERGRVGGRQRGGPRVVEVTAGQLVG